MTSLRKHELRARFRGGYDPTDLAQATEVAAILERGQAEPLPTMSASEAWAAVEARKVVEARFGAEGFWRIGPNWHRWPHLRDSNMTIVARVVDPEPEAEPTKDEAWEAYYVEHPESRPAPVSDDPLPEGVHRAPDGTLLCQGIDLPESWGFYGPPESIGASEDESRPWWDWRDRETDVRIGHVWYEVRPARPATERVPLVDAPTRKLPDGREIDVALPHDAFVAYTGPVVVVHADADGLVEVLVES